jgi:hypothetical protein
MITYQDTYEEYEERGRQIVEFCMRLGITWEQFDCVCELAANGPLDEEDDDPARVRFIAKKAKVSEEVVLAVIASFQAEDATKQ